MFFLDTNVVSEIMRELPDASVMTWMNKRQPDEVFIPSIVEAEVWVGIAFMPEGKRRSGITAQAALIFDFLFADRVIPFGSDAARAFASIMANRRRSGRPMSYSDCQNAAMARSHPAVVVTRNVRDFEGCGVEIINPWIDS